MNEGNVRGGNADQVKEDNSKMKMLKVLFLLFNVSCPMKILLSLGPDLNTHFFHNYRLPQFSFPQKTEVGRSNVF